MTENDVYEEPRCPACGEPMSYCRGHGVLGDPRGWEVLNLHEGGDHTACRFSAGCPLLELRKGLGAYYVGQLKPALLLASEERTFYYETGAARSHSLHRVKFCTPTMAMVLDDRGTTVAPICEDEHGTGASAEEAFRFALGALFGPLDEGYDNDLLRQNLILHE